MKNVAQTQRDGKRSWRSFERQKGFHIIHGEERGRKKSIIYMECRKDSFEDEIFGQVGVVKTYHHKETPNTLQNEVSKH